MKFPLSGFPFSSVPNSVCFGNISVAASSLNVKSKVLKKFRIIVAFAGSFRKIYKCRPPLLDLQGTTGKLCFLITSKNFLGLKSLYSGSTSMAPKLAIPSSSHACIPIDLIPERWSW